MTRSALRRAVRPYRRALIEWFKYTSDRLPRVLKRAGFRMLPYQQLGCERIVLIGPGIVVKTDGYAHRSRDPKLRRSRRFAPTALLASGIVIQPLGRVMTRCRGRKWRKVQEQFVRAARAVEDRFGIYDVHEGNFALFPDRSVRCIDF